MKKEANKDSREKEMLDHVSLARKEFETMRSLFKAQNNEFNKLVLEVNRRLTEFEKNLEYVRHITASAEGILLNVLTAIRQNEYYQAWAPAQHGFPEMKIVGEHPAKLAK